MKYERIKYPDGQISAKIIEFDPIEEVVIYERISSYEDLMFILSLVEVLNYRGVYKIDLQIPCLLGQRSDARFNHLQSFDLKIIANLINSCKFSNVVIYDPHSIVSLALINNSSSLSPISHILKTINKIGKVNTVLVSPDAGAYKKTFSIAERTNLPLVAAVKHRDEGGKIDLKFTGDVKDKDCLIVDDLCDGGYTFELLAKKLKAQGAGKVFLYVSHGYFSKGFDKLKEAEVEHIFCTNSVKDIDDPYVTQYKII